MSPSGAAFGDESGSDPRLDPHSYIYSTAIVLPEHADDVRANLKRLLLRGQNKLHWRMESDRHQLQIIERIATYNVEYLVVARTGVAGEKPERRRRKCLERLFHELTERGVSHAVLESRGAKDDQRDRAFLDGLRAQRALSRSIRVDHQRGHTEPLLWLADAICGAVTNLRTGNPIYTDTLGPTLTIIDI